MLTFTSILLALAMIPPASKAIAEAINRTCALDILKSSFAALAFAIIPSAAGILIQGGGVTRALGYLFCRLFFSCRLSFSRQLSFSRRLFFSRRHP